MSDGDPEAINLLRRMAPNSLIELRFMVMAMHDAYNQAGKKSWLGADKGAAAYDKFLGTIFPLVIAMWKDEVTTQESDYEETIDAIKELLITFSRAYPVWKDAYTFGQRYFFENRDVAIQVLEAIFANEANKILARR